jgi:hypothetical protein
MGHPVLSGWEEMVAWVRLFAAGGSAKVRRPGCGRVGIAGLDGKNVKDGEGEIDDESSED